MFISSCLLHTNIPHSGILYLSNNTCALGEDAEVRKDSELTGSDPGFCQISINRSIPASLLFIWCRAQEQGRDGWRTVLRSRHKHTHKHRKFFFVRLISSCSASNE